MNTKHRVTVTVEIDSEAQAGDVAAAVLAVLVCERSSAQIAALTGRSALVMCGVTGDAERFAGTFDPWGEGAPSFDLPEAR